jgi:fatty acid synthase subunit beta, fungi type
MPFDGVLIGSRVMTAFEAKTSTKVEELIAATPGTSDGDWHKTYKGSTGCIVTVMSEMGKPIYLVANRAALLWKELDGTSFCTKNEGEKQKVTPAPQRDH